MSIFLCLCSEDGTRFVSRYEEIRYERAMTDPVLTYCGCDVLELSHSLVLLRRLFHLFFKIDSLHYLFGKCEFECGMVTHQRLLLVGWHNVDVLAILPASRPLDNVIPPSWRSAFEGHRLLLAALHPVFSYHAHYILNDHAVALPIWRMSVLDFLPSLSWHIYAWLVMFHPLLTAGLIVLLSKTL